jgi:hypothetical protein
MKDHMIFMVKKNNFTSVVRQLLMQTLRTFCPSKPAPHNNDACLSHTSTLLSKTAFLQSSRTWSALCE